MSHLYSMLKDLVDHAGRHRAISPRGIIGLYSLSLDKISVYVYERAVFLQAAVIFLLRD